VPTCKDKHELVVASRLAHVGMRNLHKFQKEVHILGLMNVAFEKDRP
jgi:hypothetical protein